MINTAYLYIFICTFFFSAMEVAIKYTHGIFHPIQLNLVRFFIGGLILLPLAMKKLKKNNYILGMEDFKKFAILGFVQIVVAMSFYTISISYIPAYTAAIIFSCNTFFSIVLAFIVLRERVYWYTVLALCFSFGGVFVISNPSKFEGDVIGVFICLGAAVLFSLYGVLAKKFSHGKPISGIVLTSFSFILGSIELLVFVMISSMPSVAKILDANGFSVLANIPITKGISMYTILPLSFMVVGVTGIGFATYFMAMEHLPVSTVSLVFFIKPVLAPIIAFLILREVIIMRNAVGLGLIFIGSCILFFSSLKNTK